MAGHLQDRFLVYGRAGEACTRCGAVIRELRQAQRASCTVRTVRNAESGNAAVSRFLRGEFLVLLLQLFLRFAAIRIQRNAINGTDFLALRLVEMTDTFGALVPDR